jgi:protein-L-isoaspartate(D-aspartate) O-methyltransferase
VVETESTGNRTELIDALIAELQRQGIRDERVLSAIRRVPRERFVPDAPLEHAWANVALPIGANQTISQPYVVALMTTSLGLSGSERVLEIGTGSGYQAAVLAEVAAAVYSIERHEALANAARTLLADLGYRNVEVHVGDGSLGWPEEAPFDRIIVTAGAPKVPSPLLQQLRPDGGRIVIPVGESDDQVLLMVERRADRFHEQPLGPVRFVPLIGDQGWSIRAS